MPAHLLVNKFKGCKPVIVDGDFVADPKGGILYSDTGCCGASPDDAGSGCKATFRRVSPNDAIIEFDIPPLQIIERSGMLGDVLRLDLRVLEFHRTAQRAVAISAAASAAKTAAEVEMAGPAGAGKSAAQKDEYIRLKEWQAGDATAKTPLTPAQESAALAEAVEVQKQTYTALAQLLLKAAGA